MLVIKEHKEDADQLLYYQTQLILCETGWVKAWSQLIMAVLLKLVDTNFNQIHT